MKQILKYIMIFLLCFGFCPMIYASGTIQNRGEYIPNSQDGIPDSALYEYIKIQTGKNEVYSNDLENINELKLSDKIYSIKSLQGLNKLNMPNLHSLTLDISTLETLDDVIVLNQLFELIIEKSNLTQIPENLNQLENLRVIEIHNANIQEIPESFYRIASLETIIFDGLSIRTLSPEISHMGILERLELSNMSIEIPKEVFDIPHLRILLLNNIGLEAIPKEIGKLKYIEQISLQNNNIKSIPKELYTLSSLRVLNLRGNEITEITSAIDSLNNLQELDVSSNALTNLPLQLINIESLRVLNINDNQITCLDSDFSLLKLTNVYDFFAFNDLETCDVVIPHETTSVITLTTLNNVVSNNGITNQSVTLQANEPIIFMINMVRQNEKKAEITINNEGVYTINAISDDGSVATTFTFTIDKTSPQIKIQNNDMELNEFQSDIAIEASETVTFYVNGKQMTTGSMLLLSDNGNYEVMGVDQAGNVSNTMEFTISKETVEPQQTKINEKKTGTYIYVILAFVVAIINYLVYIFLRKGVELENQE